MKKSMKGKKPIPKKAERPKRGKKLFVIATGEQVTLDRVKENGYYFCVLGEIGSGNYQDFSPDELSEGFKQRSSINKVSDNKKDDDKIYATLRKVYLDNNPLCEAKVLGCLGKANQIHHKSGRGKNYIDIHTFLAVCDNCHRFIELNPITAKELGYSTNRL